jgi:hypothetical protein
MMDLVLKTSIANKGLVFNGRCGAIRTPDPLRPRQFPALRRNSLFSTTSFQADDAALLCLVELRGSSEL